MTDTKDTNNRCNKDDKVECVIDLENERQTVGWKKNGIIIGEIDIV